MNKPYIIFNGKNSYDDMKLILSDKNMGALALKRVSVQIPYNNKPLNFDYSDIYGKPTFEERKISYTFTISEKSEEEMFEKYNQLCEWLYCGIAELTDNDITEDYHYTARVTNVSELQRISKKVGKVVVDFAVNPYKISKDFLSCNWDDIIFATDRINAVCYIGENSATGIAYQIYNPTDHDITPQITIAGVDTLGCNCYLNGVQHIFYADISNENIDGWVLKSGLNNLTMQGIGTIKMTAVEEVL